MTFTATATIESIEKLNEKFFKVLLQDERNNHVIVNVPVDKEPELILNTKISVWGNVSAFHYQNKWYNNLFAQTVVPENKKYVLLKRIETDHDDLTRFEILEYNSEVFTKDFISKKYNLDLAEKAPKIKPSLLLEALRKAQENEDNIEEDSVTKTPPKIISEAAPKTKINLKDVLRKIRENEDDAKEDSVIKAPPKTIYANTEYSHIQNSISKNLISIENSILTILNDAAFFIKEQNASELIIFFKPDTTDFL